MITTDILLIVLVVLLVARAIQSYYQHRQLVRWLDSIGDMTGDMLRAILESLRKSGDQ